MTKDDQKTVGWNLQHIWSYFTEDPEIAAELAYSDFKALVNPDAQFLKLLRTALKYQGFDPRVFMKQLIRNRFTYLAKKNPLLTWDLSNRSGDFVATDASKDEAKFTNNETIAKDLEFLIIMMFLLRNNHISKIIKKSITGIGEILTMLQEKYKINDKVRKPGTSLGSVDVTLPMIAGVVPLVVVRMFHDGMVKEIVPYLTIPGVKDLEKVVVAQPEASSSTQEVVAPKITHAICCPFLPFLHPIVAKGGPNIHAIMLYVAVKFDDIIHEKEGYTTSLDVLLNYYRERYESVVTPPTSRVMLMRKVGLMNDQGLTFEFVNDAISVNNACLAALNSLRTDDPHHHTMMELATYGVFPNSY